MGTATNLQPKAITTSLDHYELLENILGLF